MMSKLQHMKNTIGDYFTANAPKLTPAEQKAMQTAATLPGATLAHGLIYQLTNVDNKQIDLHILARDAYMSKIGGKSLSTLRLTTTVQAGVSQYDRFFEALGQEELANQLLSQLASTKQQGISLPVVFSTFEEPISELQHGHFGLTVNMAYVSSDPLYSFKDTYKTLQHQTNTLLLDSLLSSQSDNSPLAIESRHVQHELQENYKSALLRRSLFALRQAPLNSDLDLNQAKTLVKTTAAKDKVAKETQPEEVAEDLAIEFDQELTKLAEKPAIQKHLTQLVEKSATKSAIKQVILTTEEKSPALTTKEKDDDSVFERHLLHEHDHGLPH